jgi:O-antigen/teichoic acid export membrane protein
MRDVAIITIFERSLLCLTGVAAVYFTGSLAMVGAAYLVTFVSSLALSTYLFRRNVGPFRPAFSRAAWAPMMREAVPFLTFSILSLIWTRVDIYLLTTYRAPAEVGWYNAALRVVEAQIFIPVAILGSVFPVLSRLQGWSPAEFNRILAKNFVFLLGIGLLIAGGTYLFAGPIISILFGDGYRDSAVILRIFAPMIVFSFLNYLSSGALIAMGRELLTTLTLALGAVVSVALGFAFIPRSGAEAAGWIKVVTEVVTFAFQGTLLVWMVVKARAAAAHQPQSFR